MSRIRADQILNGAGTGAPNFSLGLQVGAATTIHTTGIDLGSGNIQSHNINSTGIITAQAGVNVTGGTVIVGADPNDGSNPGCKMTTTGVIQAARASGSATSAVFMGFLEGDTSANFRVNANGSASFGSGSFTIASGGQVINSQGFQAGGDPAGGNAGSSLGETGQIQATSASNGIVFAARTSGSTTKTFEVLGNGTITATGNFTTDGSIISEANPEASDTTNGAMLDKVKVIARNATGQSLWLGYKNGTTATTSSITADGSAQFASTIWGGTSDSGSTATTSFASRLYNNSAFPTLYAKNSGNGGLWQGVNSSGTETSKINSDGSAVFQGSVKIGGNASVNEIEEYEEGTWTPVLNNGGTISANQAFYVRIGRLVYIYVYGSMSGIPNNANGFQIGGLPYTAATGNFYPSGSVGYSGSFNFANIAPLVRDNDTYIYFHTKAGSSGAIVNASATGSWPIVVTIGYYTP